MMILSTLIAISLLVGGSEAGDYDDPHTIMADMPIVHLFEWKWADIANECEQFLSNNGFGGVQTSPPSENAKITDSNNPRPWWERYQVVSYSLSTTRSGTRAEFIDMVERCNNVNVRIYPDIVVNHMTGDSGSIGTGSCGYTYGTGSYPCVPYGSNDFNTDCSVTDYNDAANVRNCRLVGLIDLNQGSEYVRTKIAAYMNDLIDIGVAGFRMDACKHMWPGDLSEIFSRLNSLNQAWFSSGAKPYIFQEVIDLGGEAITSDEYFGIGTVTEFKWSQKIGLVFRNVDGQKLSYLSNFGEGWGFISSAEAIVFTDNHDNQRGHGAGGDNVITFRDPKLYKMATGYMLAWDYGVTRVMSSYTWSPYSDNWIGPPHDGNYATLSPEFNQTTGACINNDWQCEHRWRQIYNMVKFRNAVQGTTVDNWWDNGNNQIAFSRGNRGFVAFNREDYEMNESINTGLPAGTYCDVISGNALETPNCSGKTVTVDGGGYATITIEAASGTEDGIFAIYVT